MPIHTNTIAGYEFEDIRNSLQPSSEEVELFARPGKDGVTLRLLGLRGRPHQIFTTHFVADFEAAKDALSTYVGLKDAGVHEIVQHSISFGKFFVLDVVEAESRAVSGVVGSIIPGASVRQICQWTVIHVPAS